MKKDPFDDLDSLRLTPEMLAQLKPKPEGKAPRQRQQRRLAADFYLVSEDWFNRAEIAVESSGQLLAALQIYRLWLMRPPNASDLIVSNVVLKGTSRDVKTRTLKHLQKAGLVKVVNKTGQAPRVAVHDKFERCWYACPPARP
jgi:hypothetical protein